MALSTTQIQNAYVAFFNRPADVAGLTYWGSYAGSAGDLLNTFAQSAEYNALYKGMNNTQLVNAIYQNLFGRSPDVDGLNYWVNQLDSGKVTIGNAANTIQKGAQGTDKSIIENKVLAATAFTTALDTTAEIVGYAGASSATLAQVKAWLSTVTDQASSLTAAKDALLALTTTVASGAGGTTTGQTFTLTTGQDTFNGNAGTDILRAVAGAQIGNQDQTTLNSSDVLDGAAGEDLLVVNLTGPQYIGGATIKNIETLQVGLNVATSIFDYNVNQGVYEVTGVNTIVADQVNANEDLTFNNILKTGDNIPTLHWRNEAGSVAGEVDYNHRASAVAGTTTEQKVILDNVSASLTAQANSGVLNIGAGVETLNITSQGSGKNTLNPHETQQTANAVGTFVDLASGAAGLTKVVVSGAAAFGEDANVITQTADANYGLTNRLVGADDGLSDTRSSASNLVSLANTVTEYDASAATGAQSVRFTPNANINTGVNVTFKGGSAGDYVEFELGNVTAAGNAGDDTFAFINGTNNSSFTSTDTISGGDGVDTFQIGLNGNVQTYNISATEFNNKTSIEVVDLRGSNNTVTLSQEFVDAAQQKLTVRTDRAVQTSDTDTANDMTNTPAANLLREDRMVTVLDTTNLNQNTGLKYLGGSGSDRLILDNESFNQFVELDGGTNMGQGVVATAGDYDTLTVRDSAVLDRGDLANVKGFEGIILVKSQSAAQTDITLTEAFLLANTKVNDLNAAYGETDILDQTFFIGTSRAANSNALTAGDTVNVDITDLLNGAAIKTSLTGRGIDLTSLVAAGVTVNYIVNGAVATNAQVAAVTQNDVVGVASVIGASPAIPAANVGNTLTAQAAGFNTTTGFMLTGGNGTNIATTLGDTLNTTDAFIVGSTINLAGGVDTLNVTNALTGGRLAAATVAGVENLVMQGGGTLTGADAAQGFTTITANAASTVTLAGGQTFNGSTTADNITTSAAGDVVFGNGGNDTVTSGGGTDNITTGSGTDTIVLGGGNATVATGAGADVVTFTMTGSGDNHSVNLGASDAAADQVSIINAAVSAADTDLITLTNFATSNDVLSLAVGGTSTSNGVFINGATGNGAPLVTGLGSGTILEISSASYQYAGTPNEAALLAHMTNTMGVTGAAGALITVVVYDGSGNAAILQADNSAGGASAFDAIELVGIVQGVAANSFTAANFV